MKVLIVQAEVTYNGSPPLAGATTDQIQDAVADALRSQLPADATDVEVYVHVHFETS